MVQCTGTLYVVRCRLYSDSAGLGSGSEAQWVLCFRLWTAHQHSFLRYWYVVPRIPCVRPWAQRLQRLILAQDG